MDSRNAPSVVGVEGSPKILAYGMADFSTGVSPKRAPNDSRDQRRSP